MTSLRPGAKSGGLAPRLAHRGKMLCGLWIKVTKES